MMVIKAPAGSSQDIEEKELKAAAREILERCGVTDEAKVDDIIKKMTEYLEQFQGRNPVEKILINDAIHGPIELSPLLYQIINTPEFNRLRHIKQLGAANYVYPSATHTRLDHSIGVCHLAGEFARLLRDKLTEDRKLVPKPEKKNWELTEKEVICAQIAGLCHDLGHGPFSHMFEHMVVSELPGVPHVKHEQLSVAIFKRLLVKNPKVLAQFVKEGLTYEEVKVIANMIQPTKAVEDTPKAFLYEMIANKRTGIDVDKWDYYDRDCHYLGVKTDFQSRRCMKLGRVIRDDDGKLRIAFREKELDNLYGMFRIRGNLHQKAYQHKTSKAVEKMISDAMIGAQDYPIIGLPTSGERESLQTAVMNAYKCADPECTTFKADSLEGYLALTDCTLSAIKTAAVTKQGPNAAEVLSLIERVERRDLYYLSFKVRVPKVDGPATKKWELLDKMAKNSKEHRLEMNIYERLEDKLKRKMKHTDLWVQVVKFKLASEKKDNPIEDVLFYKKPSGEGLIKPLTDEEVQKLISKLNVPGAFVEYEIRVYDKRKSSEREDMDSHAIESALLKWKEEKIDKI